MGRGSGLALLPSVPNLSLLASLVSQEPFSLPSLSLRLIASLLSCQGNPLRPPRCQAVAPAGFALTPHPDLADSPCPSLGWDCGGMLLSIEVSCISCVSQPCLPAAALLGNTQVP